ncbi:MULTISPECIES: thioredoxin family protein [unclassified Clostridium]|uniref:thioredoxin family protein n=1 Tax=unclassified Clostridium TaxID=2614128 RepID=UPI001106D7E1|nr:MULTISPECIES: thioredoxin family protein [unclassified Clostridium]MBY1896620.1 thioredoxin family protein [Clostridioides difficile]
MDKKKSLIAKILIPILIAVAIIAIFIAKNMQNPTTEPSVIDSTKQTDNDKGFPLKVTSVSLEEIKQYGIPTVIDFGSDSCIPCKQMAPVLETLNSEWQGKAAVQFMDVWEYTDGVENFPVQVIPTQVFFNADGTPFVPSDELASKIQFTMYSDKSNDEHIFTVHQGGITEEEMREIFAEMGVE